jgi:hypothetical protein
MLGRATSIGARYLFIGAVAAVGVAAVAAAEMVGGGEDEGWALHVEVFGAEGLAGGGDVAGAGSGALDFVWLNFAHEKRPGKGAG